MPDNTPERASGGADSKSKGSAEDIFATHPAALALPEAPRVTLTIDFGGLTLDSIQALAGFLQSTLAAHPATAIGRAESTLAKASLASGATTGEAKKN